jgi:hypothetical protein
VCGGGIYGADDITPLDVADGPIIINNIIRYNHAMAGGGGISFGHRGTGLVINNTIYGNFGTVGGGFYDYGNRGSLVINCIFWNNQADSVNEICIVDSNATLEHCNIQGGFPGDGNIDADPFFRNPLNGDFHLMSIACGDSADSPSIDMGDPGILDSLLDCFWGLGANRSDMGAYGGGDSLIVGISDNGEISPNLFTFSQNYPNPFNAQTNISFPLHLPCHVNIDIYDILGRKVATIFDDDKSAGEYQVIWNASDASSGIYFYRIAAGNKIETKKMVLLR